MNTEVKGYKLKLNAPTSDYFEVRFKADSNDGDYVTTTTRLSVDKFNADGVKALNKLLTKYRGANKLENIYDKDSWISDIIDVPNGECGVCHTLTELQVKLYKTDGTIYIVEMDPEIYTGD